MESGIPTPLRWLESPGVGIAFSRNRLTSSLVDFSNLVSSKEPHRGGFKHPSSTFMERKVYFHESGRRELETPLTYIPYEVLYWKPSHT